MAVIISVEAVSATQTLENVLIKNIANPNVLITDKSSIKFQKRLARPSAVCIHKSKFLRFNSKAIKFIIIDVDHILIKTFMYRYSVLLNALEPTWVTETTSGVQVCFALKDPLPVRAMSKKTKGYLTALKKHIVERFKGDMKGSMRNYGMWRNPLAHEHIFSDVEYSLGDLAKAFELPEPSRKRSKVTPLFNRVPGFAVGGRNDALYWTAVLQINANPCVSESGMGEWAQRVNSEQSSPLDDAEAIKTGRSAWRQYHEKGKRLKFKVVFSDVFGKKAWKKMYNAKQYVEKIKRGDEMTRSENLIKQNKLKARKAREQVVGVLTSMKLFGEKPTAVAVAENAGLDRRTASKYLKELKEEGYIFDW
jgi:hypothetical protein